MASMKEVATSGDLKVGTFVCEFAIPGIGYILKNAGLDFVFLDMEHSGFDVSTLKSMLRYFEAADLPCIVRPAGKDYYDMARMLDMGAEALCLPMVSSAEEARAIVRQCKYVPMGERGVALGIMHDRFIAPNAFSPPNEAYAKFGFSAMAPLPTSSISSGPTGCVRVCA